MSKNLNKSASQPKRVRYRTSKRWIANAIKKIKKHLKTHDKKGKDLKARLVLTQYENGTKSVRIRGKRKIFATMQLSSDKSQKKFSQKQMKKKAKGLIK